jgi:hypothetical protein
VCDHTYLTHILSHYDTLAEWTVFYKGRHEPFCPPLSLLPPPLSSPLSTPTPTSTLLSLHANVSQFICCNGHDAKVHKILQPGGRFRMLEYSPRYNPAGHHRFHRYNGTMGNWTAKTFGSKNARYLFSLGPRFCFGGYFAAPRHLIHKHPKELYWSMIIQQQYALEEVDHFIERLWALLFQSDRIECHEEDDSSDWEERKFISIEVSSVEWRNIFFN